MIGYAILAPSGHNTQPWLFRIGAADVDVIADRTRALPVVDPFDRALVISCGAALAFLEIAARRFGLKTHVDLMPDIMDTDVIARVRFAKGAVVSVQDRSLFEAIPKRRTNRTAFAMTAPPDSLVADCQAAMEPLNIELAYVADTGKRTALAALVAEGDRRQFADPRFRRELASWVHSRRGHSKDGMSGASFGMPDIFSAIGGLVIRTFDMGKGIGAADAKKIVSSTPALMVFGSAETPTGWINTGRALGHVSLLVTRAGLSLSYLNQPIETEPLRPQVRDVANMQSIPQILIRVGTADEQVAATARRDPDAVILKEDTVV